MVAVLAAAETAVVATAAVGEVVAARGGASALEGEEMAQVVHPIHNQIALAQRKC